MIDNYTKQFATMLSDEVNNITADGTPERQKCEMLAVLATLAFGQILKEFRQDIEIISDKIKDDSI